MQQESMYLIKSVLNRIPRRETFTIHDIRIQNDDGD